MLTEIVPMRGGGRHKGLEKPYFAVSKSGRKGKSGYIVFMIYERMMKSLRWIPGDRVAVFVDKDRGYVHLRRVKAGGYSLVANGTSASICMAANEGLTLVSYSPVKEDDCAVIDGDFVFPYPFPK